MNLCDGQKVRVLDVRYNQSILKRNGDTKVHIVLHDDILTVQRRIDVRELDQGGGYRLDENIGERNFDIGFLELVAEPDGLGHIHLHAVIGLGHLGKASGHVVRNRLAHAGKRDDGLRLLVHDFGRTRRCNRRPKHRPS